MDVLGLLVRLLAAVYGLVVAVLAVPRVLVLRSGEVSAASAWGDEDGRARVRWLGGEQRRLAGVATAG